MNTTTNMTNTNAATAQAPPAVAISRAIVASALVRAFPKLTREPLDVDMSAVLENTVSFQSN